MYQQPSIVYTLKQLSQAYQVTHVTMKSYIKKHLPVASALWYSGTQKRYYSDKEVQLIFDALGEPGSQKAAFNKYARNTTP